MSSQISLSSPGLFQTPDTCTQPSIQNLHHTRNIPHTTPDFTSAAALLPSRLTFSGILTTDWAHPSLFSFPYSRIDLSANPVVSTRKNMQFSPYLSCLPLSTPPPLLPTGLLSAIPDATSPQRSALVGPWHLEHCSPRSPTKVFPSSLQRPFQATKYTTAPLGYAIHCTLSTLFFHSNFHCLVFYLGPTYLFSRMFFCTQ